MLTRNFEDYLTAWQKNPARKPLVIRGARQVGKTYLVKSFAKKHYANFIHLNLENKDTFKLFGAVDNLETFSSVVKLGLKQDIDIPETLLFIDEIQNSPSLMSLLRFFYEDKPNTHVICAGSLLEAKMEREGLSMPVGRVEYGYMYPLTFFEFLSAMDRDDLKDYLINIDLAKSKALPQGIHLLLIDLFRKYTLLGGMPEILSSYISTGGNLEECKKILRNLSVTYENDVYKYTSAENAKYLSHVIGSGPAHAGALYKYENFADSEFKSREMSGAFDLLEKVMLLRQIRSTSVNSLPFVAKEKRSKKLIWLDVGFVNMSANTYESFINIKDLGDLYRGRLAEQVVGQNILASGKFYAPVDLYYWSRDKDKGIAEVDFCLQIGGRAVAVEVKSGSTGKARSLQSFKNEFKTAGLVKVSEANFGMRDDIVLLPFYLINRIFEL